jgi:hypothetical protein
MNPAVDCSMLSAAMSLGSQVASVQRRLFHFLARSHAKSDYCKASFPSVRLPA